MNNKIQKLAEALRQAVIEDASDITTRVVVYMNSEGNNFEIIQRTPESLKRDSISMQNIKGVFIQ